MSGVPKMTDAPKVAEPRAVVFDVGWVLVQWDLRHIYTDLIPDPARREWFVTHVVTPQWHFEHDAGRELDDLLAEKIAEYPEHAALIRAYATHFNDSIPGPVPGTAKLVERLSARGVPLYALTNFAAPFWDAFRPLYPVLDHFRDIVVSGVEKVAKPDPAIYHLAEQRFGYAGTDIFFTDDNPANIEAAKAMGWNALQFTDAPALEAELVRIGLLD